MIRLHISRDGLIDLYWDFRVVDATFAVEHMTLSGNITLAEEETAVHIKV